MPKLLRRLHQDHVNGLRLLAMLDHQIEIIGAGRRPDWDIVQDVIQYFLTYPRQAHHPCEDLILGRLRAKNLTAAEPFLGLESDHRQLSDTLQHMASVTERLVPLVRANYLDLLRSFSAGQREHIHLEEGGFLPAARRLLDARDWQQLERIAPEITDPLSDAADHRFQTLRRAFAHWDGAAGDAVETRERRSRA